ncbi:MULTISPECIES: putative porin [Flavobacterium]|uniref:putative porin n=1 Tax=Flavobacterium TaxID=237 RepID=UPI001FCBBA1F|nr:MULTISPECIES: putative porin [Flavobacterium]UOK42581.1 putative porin [Flavobacterium enshiense]
MKQGLFCLLFLFSISFSAFAQDDDLQLEKKASNDKAEKKATVDLYKIISIERDTTIVDTSLTIKREYKFNYLRKDIFGLLPFLNEGQTYNTLDFGLTHFNPFPEFGFLAKHFNYLEVRDINYYNLPTPYSDMYFKSVMEQGQNLDAFVSANVSKNLNFAVGYKGLRSLGKYQNQLSSTGNLKLISSYNTKDKRYFLKAHMTAQDILNHENGGIKVLSQFESGDDLYQERSRIDVNFYDAQSLLNGKRFFVDHSFKLSKSPSSVVLNHQFNYEYKYFELSMAAHERFGESYSSFINNKTRYNRMYNKFGAAYSHKYLGDFNFFVENYQYNYYYYRTVVQASGAFVPNAINDKINTWGGQYIYNKDKWKGTFLISNSITNQSLANLDANIRYTLNENNVFSFRYQNMNKLPNLNYVLYQSDYKEYNWNNSFKNEKINNIEVEAKTKWFEASMQYSVLNDHLYFANQNPTYNVEGIANQLIVKPLQYEKTINYLSIKAGNEIKVGKFGLDNTFLFQQVEQSDNILNVPQFTTRNSLYYSDYFFKKALFLQTGFTFNYFTKYKANDYNPLLGEFYIQEQKEVGGYPVFDYFLNAKIRTFRVFFKAEHINSSITGYDFYTAPNYPYRDFMIRFGLVWNFFS